MKTISWLVLFLAAALGDSESGTSTCNPEEGTCSLYPILGRPDEFIESSQGLKLAVRRWKPSDNVQAVVVFQHGGAGFHSAYSDTMGRSLSDAGIAVVAYDQAGSGYSEGPRNYADSIDTVCDDFSKVLQQVKAEYPGKKVFAMGESFGAFVILMQSLREQTKTDGALADGYILSGPVIKLLPEMLPPKPLVVVLVFFARFFPMLKMPGTDFFSTFDLAFGDKAWAQTGRNDPIIQEAATIAPRLGMIASVLNAMGSLNKHFADVKVPIKILVGEHEGRVDVDAIHSLHRESSSTDKDLEVVADGYHQLFQDVPEVTNLVCKHVIEWILARS